MDMADVMRLQRSVLGLSQADLAKASGLSLRQIARYEAGEQQPVLKVAVALADALDISIAQLAGQESDGLDLSGQWWASWETSKDGVPRIDTHTLHIAQRGQRLTLDADNARTVEEGSYAWRGELRLWDSESLIGWYHSTEGAVRSKGSMYFALHPHGEHAWGRWVGLSYDGMVATGWGGLSREKGMSANIVRRLIDTKGRSNGSVSEHHSHR
ncbi:MAG: helix-turn-helix domain-containing protein [Rhodoglobus sp.]